MPDLQNLNLKSESVEVDYDKYVDPSEFPPPITEAIYTFKQGKPAFEASNEGYLVAVFDHLVEGGDQNGRQLRFDRVSDKPFNREGVQVSMAADHLRAVGDSGHYRTHEDIARALENSEGRPFKAQTQWEAYCNPKNGGCGKSVKGERNFPASPSGNGHLPEITCPTPNCGQTIRANSRISRRIPA